MNSTALTVFLIITFVSIAIDILVAVKSGEKQNPTGVSLGFTAIGAAFACITYSMSVMSTEYFYFSLWSSIYFISISWMLVFLLNFILYYTRMEISFPKCVRIGILGYLVIETVLFLINPFHQVSIGYLPSGNDLVKYVYDIHFLYYFHLIFTYGLVCLSIYLLARKALSVPNQYRIKFVGICYSIIFIVCINGIFLFIQGKTVLSILDCSVFTYSVVVVIVYWLSIHTSNKSLLEGLSMTVFSSLDQGIMLFDYDGIIVLKNSKADDFFNEIIGIDDEFNVHDLIERAEINIDESLTEDNCSLQCYIKKGNRDIPVRCDYSCLRDERGQLISYLFVFTDLEMETDLLTEFHNWEYFNHYASKNPDMFYYPMGVVAFDINNLGIINSSFGKDAGDAQISQLAEVMRRCFTKDTYFVRREACLLALCYNANKSNITYCSELVRKEFDGSIQYAFALTERNNPDISNAIEEAYKALRTKKLLDRESNRSQVLTSLLQALQESDEDTEAHVHRTQYMGRELGKRLGLSDSKLSDLSLLCLLHDIGKIGIPLEILNKPGKLTADEWRVLKTHTEKGYQIAMSSRDFSHIADEILHHHERWDGKGYPSGLSRESIPLLSRIISVIDAFDAMTSERAYKKRMSFEDAVEELRTTAGSQFDPHITSQFIEMIVENPEIYKSQHSDDEVIEQVDDCYESYESDGNIFTNSHTVFHTIYKLDKDDYIIDVDDNFETITGYSKEEIEANNYRQADLILDEDKSEYFILVNESMAKNPIAYLEHRIIRKDGDVIYVMCYGRRYFDSAAKEERVEIILSKITDTYAIKTIAEVEDNKARTRLQQWENTYRRDSLTGLLTHIAFQNDVELKLLTENCKVLFLMIDVDKFKNYNDTYGHKAGDEYLIFVGNTIKSALRREDLACRMGGDEFACALFFRQEHSDEFIYQRAHQIFEKINLSLGLGNTPMSLSMGAVISSEELNTFVKLYQTADENLYESKNKGRGRLTVGDSEK